MSNRVIPVPKLCTSSVVGQFENIRFSIINPIGKKSLFNDTINFKKGCPSSG